jgi:hypothetical protein
VVDGDFVMEVWGIADMIGLRLIRFSSVCFVMKMRLFLDFSFDFLSFQIWIFPVTKHL